MRNLSTCRNKGSALIFVILMLVLMISMAIGFLSMVGRQLGSSINIASQTKADIAVMQAQAHVIKTALKTADVARNKNGTAVPYTTMFNPDWRTEFAAVTDPDGNPFTEDGEPRRAGTRSSISASTTEVSKHPLVNSPINLFDMVGSDTQTAYSPDYGFAPYMSRRRGGANNLHISRWHNVEYLDEEFQHIDIDPGLPEIDKAALRESARYVVRYMAQVMDVNAMQSINNNFPLMLQDGTTVDPGPGPVDSTHYLRYQNYLRAYGRSFKSQLGSGGMQYRSDDLHFISVDPLDTETVNIAANGQDVERYYTATMALDYDSRLRLERAFRDGDLQWTNGSLYANQVLTSNHKGRTHTWGHISEAFIGNTLRVSNRPPVVPYADSLQDEDLADPALVGAGVVKPGPVSTPWRVNLLSVPNTTLNRMVCGLSAELRFDDKGSTNELRSQSSADANADLFGKGYPEPFPLPLDAGRDVPLIGDASSRKDDQGKFWFDIGDGSRGGGTYVFANANWGGTRYLSPGYQNSYWMDIYMALGLALRDARQVWVTEEPLSTGPQILGPDFYEYIGGTNNSYIDAMETDPKRMINQILQETYRILGEGRILAGTPATSENFFNPGDESLLGGGVNFVGAGSNEFYQFRAQLSPTANTRAMEYALNDVMISLFGKANPYFDPDSDTLSEDIAVDFNGDGYAESTVTGWYNPETGTRYWSWWWDGLGPYVNVSAQNYYMKNPGWYRFDDAGTILRKVGEEWKPIPDKTSFLAYNDIWLTGDPMYPIKPFAKTGRLFIGKSKIIHGFVRGEVYNILSQKTMASLDRNFAYHVDPNDDGDFSDSHLLMQTDATIVPE